jgi:hypothetical protein
MFSTEIVPPNEPPSGIPVSHPPSFLSAEELCRVAAGLVGGPRRVTHGDKSINFINTAEAWNALLRAKARQSLLPVERIPILDALDVANMLELFKVSRRYSGKFNLDDYIDGAGYAACAGEIAAKWDLEEEPYNQRDPEGGPR